jgi:peroxiredoxin
MKNPMLGIIIVALMAFFSCGENASQIDGIVKVSGKLANAPEGVVILSQFTDSRPIVLDTLDLSNDGEFSYDLKLEVPSFYELNLQGKNSIRLALFKEDVEVNYDFADSTSLVIEGSNDSKEMVKIETMMTAYQAKVNELNESYYQAMSTNDAAAIAKIQSNAMLLESSQAEEVKKVIKSMDGSFAALAAIGLLNPKNDFPFIDEIVTALNDKYPNTPMISTMKVQLDEMRALSVGQVAPDFELPNPQGQMIKLSSLKGKYVMIDFWAAWCKPCRAENPNVVRMYNQYKDKGFEVFGVSLDRTREDWVKAIEVDGLTWPQVSDLKYFNSAAATLYKIDAIPATYLLDPEGKIIAKDLRGASLEAKLAELFD